jgi:hypothetical protein
LEQATNLLANRGNIASGGLLAHIKAEEDRKTLGEIRDGLSNTQHQITNELETVRLKKFKSLLELLA